MAIAALSAAEVAALKKAAAYPPATVWGPKDSGLLNLFDMQSMPRLLDKGLIQVVGEFDGAGPAYHWTPLGLIVANLVATRLTKFKADPDSEKKTESANPAGLESAGANEETGKPEKHEPGNPEQAK
jgi:hypothetical protein